MVKEAINKKDIRDAFLLSLILLIIGLIIIQFRWINADEGAHLTDAKLLLSGKIPLVDFQSRQPFYVLLLALFLKIFGMSFISGRLLILFACVGNSVLINLIAHKIFGRESVRIFYHQIFSPQLIKRLHLLILVHALMIFQSVVTEDEFW